MYQKTVEKEVRHKASRVLSKEASDIIEARKDPEFRKFIRAFVKYHTDSK